MAREEPPAPSTSAVFPYADVLRHCRKPGASVLSAWIVPSALNVSVFAA
jgi:hypothetical protein